MLQVLTQPVGSIAGFEFDGLSPEALTLQDYTGLKLLKESMASMPQEGSPTKLTCAPKIIVMWGSLFPSVQILPKRLGTLLPTSLSPDLRRANAQEKSWGVCSRFPLFW